MDRRRSTEEQIIGVLKEAAAGAKAADLCRKYGMSEPTFYKWKAKYSGLTVSELKRLKTLEEDNRVLKELAQQRRRFGCPRLHVVAAAGGMEDQP